MLDFNINGEILIPFYNSSTLSTDKNTSLSIKDICNHTYSDFRNILFQGELIKLYILLQPDNMDPSRIKNFLDNLFFKIELESTIDVGNNSESENILEQTVNDLFTINSEKIDEKNYEYDNIVNKLYDEESKTEIYEVYKQIIVPKNFLRKQLIMKLQILTKNEDMIEIKENNSDTFLYYKTGHFTNVERFKILKTLFKEVKVIKPFNISDTKQIDLTMDMSLLQIKIENIANEITYEDNSLKNSRFLKKGEEILDEKINKKDWNKHNFMTNFIINEIEILEDETSMNEKETEKIDFIKKYLLKKKTSMQSDMSFTLMENNFPIEIHSGEEYILSVKVNKNCFLTDTDIYPNNNTNNEPPERISSAHTEDSLISPAGNIDNNINNNKNINNTQGETKVKKKVNFNTNAIVVTKKSVLNKMQERHCLLSNNTHLNTENPIPLHDIYQRSIGNKQININRTETNTMFSLRDFNEENIKIYYITPVLLYISSNLFYENLFLSLQLKWYQELNRLLKIEIKIPEEINLHEYFEVNVKIRNISSKVMNLLIEMKENEENMASNKTNNFEYMPGIISQIKFQSLGMFNCNEDKIFKLKFLATKYGFNYLPNFSITDTLSNLRFYIVQNNKIFIKNSDLKKRPSQNVLNRLISTSL